MKKFLFSLLVFSFGFFLEYSLDIFKSDSPEFEIPFTPAISDEIIFVTKDRVCVIFGYNILISQEDTVYSSLMRMELRNHIINFGKEHNSQEFIIEKQYAKVTSEMYDLVVNLCDASLPSPWNHVTFTKPKVIHCNTY